MTQKNPKWLKRSQRQAGRQKLIRERLTKGQIFWESKKKKIQTHFPASLGRVKQWLMPLQWRVNNSSESRNFYFSFPLYLGSVRYEWQTPPNYPLMNAVLLHRGFTTCAPSQVQPPILNKSIKSGSRPGMVSANTQGGKSRRLSVNLRPAGSTQPIPDQSGLHRDLIPKGTPTHSGKR